MNKLEITQEKIMKKYPRLIAHLIAESLGYFTPESAANAIILHKNDKEFWCEWYISMAEKRDKSNRRYSLVDIGREILKSAYTRRQFHKGYMADYTRARVLVTKSIDGTDPILASWF